MSWIRLRQVALVARDLEAVVSDLRTSFGLEVAHRDPAVASFGLENAVLPVGNQFIEVVSPTREGTAGGRQLERLGGDGGYMVICHTDNHAAVRQRVTELGVRAVIDADHDGYRLLQLHPSDTGGSFLEIDFQPGGDDPGGPWMPAGEEWQAARRTQVVAGIRALDVESRDPSTTAERWRAITGCPLEGLVLRLDNATVTFREGDLDSLVGVTLAAADASRAGEGRIIGGVAFTVVPT